MNDTAHLDQAETDVIIDADDASGANATTTDDQGATRPMPADATPAAPRPADVPADAPAPPAGGGARRGSFYRDAWRHVPRDLGYMALTAVLLGSLYWLFPGAVFGGGFGDGGIGIFAAILIFFSLWVARWLGNFEKLRIGWAEPREIRPVDWTPRWQQNGWTRLGSAVANPHSWLYLLHAIVVYPLVASITVGVGAALVAGFFGPIVAGIAALANGWRINILLMHAGIGQDFAWVTAAILCVVSMAAAVVLFPLWLRGSVLGHYWVDHALLGGFKAEVLQRRVVGLQESRAGIVTAEGQALRQIERDLHDGPQQRLVRLRMDLSAAERALDKQPAEPSRARQLIAEASAHAKDALDEIRALSRGFAPPILLDRGLVAALEALASRTPLPVGLDIRLPQGLALPTEVERNVYFTVSELLTNTTKHAGARTAGVFIAIVDDAAGQPVLTVSVTDDGRGGASPREGHGIEGLMGRMRALDGQLVVSSPVGGPTEATARIPLGALHGTPTWRPEATGPTVGS